METPESARAAREGRTMNSDEQRADYRRRLAARADRWRRLATRRQEVPPGECPTCDAHRGGMHPPHDASPRCESGGHTHCTCDTCF